MSAGNLTTSFVKRSTIVPTEQSQKGKKSISHSLGAQLFCALHLLV